MFGQDGKPACRYAYIGFPRKNGKSTLGAALAIYALVCLGPASHVYSCAGDRKQASIVFDEAKRMVLAEPELAEIIRVQRWHLEGPHDSVYRVLSADAELQQGLNPSFVIFDEVHVQPNEDLWNAMVMGMGARARPMIVGITTAGYDEESLAYRLFAYGKSLEAGQVEDPAFYFRWYEPSQPDADYRDPAVWYEANPALGDFLTVEPFQTAVRSGFPKESAFRRFYLNQWTAAEELWLPAGAWEDQRATFALDRKLPVAVGIDPAYSDDTFAVVVAQKRDEDIYLRARFFMNPYPVGHSQRSEWIVDHEEVRGYLRDLAREFPVPATKIDGRTISGPAFIYDPSSFTESAQILEEEGLAMIEFPQTDARMLPATRLFYDLLMAKHVWHDGDAVLASHFRNVHAVERGENGWRLRKATKSSARKIDGAIASVLAVWQAMVPPPPRRAGSFLA